MSKLRFRFSGHESFPCRYTWLPKAFQSCVENPLLFSDEDVAMVRLGVGKNMVRSIRFWMQAFGVLRQDIEGKGFQPTLFGRMLLQDNGLDPFLEDVRTLWLLHWKIASNTEDPLFAWYYLINQWPDSFFSKTLAIAAFTKESERLERPLSDFTKEQHFDIFLHTYLPVKGKKASEVVEDSLDCPLTELRFIIPAGERITDHGRREPVFEFRQESKPEITASLFIYCLFDYWRSNRINESSISFRDVASTAGTLGQTFKLSEGELRTRLESIKADSDGRFEYMDSATLPRVIRNCDFSNKTERILLTNIYKMQRKQHKKLVDSHAG